MKSGIIAIILSIIVILMITTNISYGKYVLEDTLIAAELNINIQE